MSICYVSCSEKNVFIEIRTKTHVGTTYDVDTFCTFLEKYQSKIIAENFMRILLRLFDTLLS